MRRSTDCKLETYCYLPGPLIETMARRLGARQAISSDRPLISGQNFAGTVLPMPSVSILSPSVPLLTRWALTLSARLSESFWLYLWLPIRSVCPSMTTASTCAQVTSFAITSRSRRALAACVSCDFMNAKTSSFWKVTVASHRLGAGAGAGAAWRSAGGATGRDRGAAAGAGWGCGAGSGAVAQDASRTALPTARVSLFTRLSFCGTRAGSFFDLVIGGAHTPHPRAAAQSSRRENRGIRTASRVVREVLT